MPCRCFGGQFLLFNEPILQMAKIIETPQNNGKKICRFIVKKNKKKLKIPAPINRMSATVVEQRYGEGLEQKIASNELQYYH